MIKLILLKTVFRANRFIVKISTVHRLMDLSLTDDADPCSGKYLGLKKLKLVQLFCRNGFKE